MLAPDFCFLQPDMIFVKKNYTTTVFGANFYTQILRELRHMRIRDKTAQMPV